MAQLFSTTVHGANGTDFKTSLTMAFPSTTCFLQQLSPAVVYNGTSCVTAIKMLGQGTNPMPDEFYSAETVAALAAKANAALITP
jgi:hypothetical protein